MTEDLNSNERKAKRAYSVCSLSLFVSGVISLFGGLGLALFFGYLKKSGSPLASDPYFTWGIRIFLMYCVVFPAGLLLMRTVPANQPEKLKLSAGGLLGYFLMCFPLMAAGAIVGNMLSALFSGGTAVNPTEQLAADGNVLRIIMTVVLAPLFEELLFRKYLIDRTSAYGEKTAVIFSAVVFGMFHGNLFQFFYAAGTGLIFAYIYVRTGKLRYSVALHMMINLLGSVIAPLIDGMKARSGWAGAAGNVVSTLYSAIYLALTVIGAALLIAKRRRIVFRPAPEQLPEGLGFKTACLNTGFILFAVYCAADVVMSLM